MEPNIRKINKYRKFSEDFKRKLVEEFESGKFSVRELGELHKLSEVSIYNWIYKYSTLNKRGSRIVEMEKSSTQKIKDLDNKVRELERIVGQKQIKIDYLDKMIDLAEEELGVDIKKNSNIPPSAGSIKEKRS